MSNNSNKKNNNKKQESGEIKEIRIIQDKDQNQEEIQEVVEQVVVVKPRLMKTTKLGHWYITGDFQLKEKDAAPILNTGIRKSMLELLLTRAYVKEVLGLDIPEKLEETIQKAVKVIRGYSPGEIAKKQEILNKRVMEIKNEVKRITIGNDLHESYYQLVRAQRAPVSLLEEQDEQDIPF